MLPLSEPETGSRSPLATFCLLSISAFFCSGEYSSLQSSLDGIASVSIAIIAFCCASRACFATSGGASGRSGVAIHAGGAGYGSVAGAGDCFLFFNSSSNLLASAICSGVASGTSSCATNLDIIECLNASSLLAYAPRVFCHSFCFGVTAKLALYPDSPIRCLTASIFISPSRFTGSDIY